MALRAALADHPAPVGPSDRVSVSPADGTATIHLDDGSQAQIHLPFTEVKATAPTIDARTAMFQDTQTGTSVAVQPLSTNGVRMVLTLATPDAPRRFEFDLGGDAPVVLRRIESGGVIVTDRDGDEIGYIPPPWAQDARGASVPTHFEIEGSTLIQVVDHEGAMYPVVADPSFQGDCGYTTCTLRFNRARTRDARDASWLISAAAGACGVATGGTLALVCGAAIAPAAVVIAVAAGRYYEDGDCLKIKFPVIGGIAWPGRVKHGDYNCTDK
jgi:hypothetical protein